MHYGLDRVRFVVFKNYKMSALPKGGNKALFKTDLRGNTPNKQV